MFTSDSIVLMLLSVDVDDVDVDAHHGVEFDRWLSLSLFHWFSNRHNNPIYKAIIMPPAAEESHAPPGVPYEPEDVEGEESDDYDIDVGGNGLFWFPSERTL
jgi:hypothetical protein